MKQAAAMPFFGGEEALMASSCFVEVMAAIVRGIEEEPKGQ